MKSVRGHNLHNDREAYLFRRSNSFFLVFRDRRGCNRDAALIEEFERFLANYVALFIDPLLQSFLSMEGVWWNDVSMLVCFLACQFL